MSFIFYSAEKKVAPAVVKIALKIVEEKIRISVDIV